MTMASMVALAAIGGVACFNIVRDPLGEKRAWLNRATEEAPMQPSSVTGLPAGESDALYSLTTERPKLWAPLVPGAAPPPPAPEAPNLDKALEGVVPTYRQIGAKIVVKTPGNPRGTEMGVGDRINGVAIKEIRRSEVVFALVVNGQEYTKVVSRR